MAVHDSPALLSHHLSILLIEADDAERARIEGMLHGEFHDLRVAEEGAAALAMLRERPADVVLADIALPGMDGLALTRELLRRRPEQVVVLITPPHGPELLGQVTRGGVAGLVFKPVVAEPLFAALYQGGARARERHALVTDAETGLYNRRRLNEHLEARRHHPLLLLQLDNLPSINRALGFDRGSRASREVARLLRREAPAESDLYRLAPGLFLLAFPAAELAWVERFARRLHTRLSTEPLRLGGELHAPPRATLAVVEGVGSGAVDAARNTLLAARERGEAVRVARGGCPVADEQEATAAWVGRVRAALAAGRVVPWFQPIVRNTDGSVAKYECLARLVEGGRVFEPAAFIAPARLGGLISAVTRAIVDRSMATFVGNHHAFSINITEEDLHDRRFAERMLARAAHYDIPPRRVIFEILEEASVEHDGNVPEQLTRLRELGFQVAIDDFGAEHANFARLLDLQADYIKIDACFIRDLDTHPRCGAVCEAITRLAHQFDARVVAEHVHTESVQRAVCELGIEFSQGYYFGEPRPELQ